MILDGTSKSLEQKVSEVQKLYLSKGLSIEYITIEEVHRMMDICDCTEDEVIQDLIYESWGDDC